MQLAYKADQALPKSWIARWFTTSLSISGIDTQQFKAQWGRLEHRL